MFLRLCSRAPLTWMWSSGISPPRAPSPLRPRRARAVIAGAHPCGREPGQEPEAPAERTEREPAQGILPAAPLDLARERGRPRLIRRSTVDELAAAGRREAGVQERHEADRERDDTGERGEIQVRSEQGRRRQLDGLPALLDQGRDQEHDEGDHDERDRGGEERRHAPVPRRKSVTTSRRNASQTMSDTRPGMRLSPTPGRNVSAVTGRIAFASSW